MRSYMYFLLLFLFSTLSVTGQSFNEAVDNNELTFTHGGDAEWIVTTTNTSDGVDAVRSDSITHNQSSYFETTITGPGFLSFKWKVSSENSFDFLRFYIDNVLQESISGLTNWEQKEIEIPEGSYTIKWAYTKDGSVNSREDCGWIDQIFFATCPAPTDLIIDNVTNNSVELEWTDSHSPINWTLEYGETGFTPGEGTSLTVNTTNYLLTNLSESTSYDVYLKANCTLSDDSDWVGPSSFATMGDRFNEAVSNQELTFSLGGSATWSVTTDTSWDGEGSVKSGPISNNQSSYFETSVEGPGELRFRWKVSSTPNDHNLSFLINGSSQKTISGVTDWMVETINIPEGQHILRWNYSKMWSSAQGEDCGWIDQIQYSKTNENCSPTINVNFDEITANSSTMQLETPDGGDPISWHIQYGEALFLPGEGTNHISYIKQYQLSNLTPGTNYYAYIKAYCGPGNESHWNGPFSFQTIDDGSNENSCPTATSWSVDEITTSSANLQWESSGDSDPTSWQIEYGKTDFIPGEGTTLISYMNSSFIYGLSEATTYDVYLKANCGPSVETNWVVGPFTFETIDGNPDEPAISFIDAVDNQSITITHGGNAEWEVTTETTYDAEDAVKSGTISHNQLSYFEASFKGPGILSFQWKVSSEGNYDYLRYYINGTLQESISGSSNWEQKEIAIPSGSHTIRWAYTKDGSVHRYDDCGWIDEIIYSEAGDECLPAIELFTVNKTNSSVELNWVEHVSPISWSIEYGESGFSQGEGTLHTSYTNNYVLIGLSPGTNYDYYVRANCGPDKQSEWSGPHSFQTTNTGSNNGNCPASTNLYSVETTKTSADLEWNANGTPISWTLEFGESGFSQGEGTMLTSYVAKYFLSNLSPGTTYDVYVQSYCGPNTPRSNWAGPFSFQTNFESVDVPLTENFDQVTSPSLPAQWSTAGEGYYSVSTAYFGNSLFSSPNAGSLFKGNNGDAALISPEINQPLSSLRLNFKAAYHNYYNDPQFTPKIIVGTISDPADLSTFTAVETIELTSRRNSVWQEITIYLTDHSTSDRHIAIKTYNEYSYYYYYIAYVDDITIDIAPSNPEPTNLMVTTIDESRVSLSWTDNGHNISWDVKYGPEGFNPENQGYSVKAFQQETILTGLDPELIYDAYVRVAGTRQTEWSDRISFSTTQGTLIGRRNPGLYYSDVDNVTTSINSQESASKNSLSVYPNPIKDELTIIGDNLNPDEVIIITDLSGKTIMTTTLREQPFNLSSFPEGVYLLRMGDKVLKFIKE